MKLKNFPHDLECMQNWGPLEPHFISQVYLQADITEALKTTDVSSTGSEGIDMRYG